MRSFCGTAGVELYMRVKCKGDLSSLLEVYDRLGIFFIQFYKKGSIECHDSPEEKSYHFAEVSIDTSAVPP